MGSYSRRSSCAGRQCVCWLPALVSDVSRLDESAVTGQEGVVVAGAARLAPPAGAKQWDAVARNTNLTVVREGRARETAGKTGPEVDHLPARGRVRQHREGDAGG